MPDIPDFNRAVVLQWWTDHRGILYSESSEEWVRQVVTAVQAASSWSDLRSRLPHGGESALNIEEAEEEGEYRPELVNREGLLASDLLSDAAERTRVPRQIQERFGKWEGSPAAGSWCLYELDRAEELRAALREADIDLRLIRSENELPDWW